MAMPIDSLGYSVLTRRFPLPVLMLLATLTEPAESRRETPYATFVNSTRLIDLFYQLYPNGDYYSMFIAWRNLSFDEAREWLFSTIVEPEASDQEVITLLDTIAATFCMAIPDTNKFGSNRLQAAQQALLTPTEDRIRRLTAALKTSMVCAGCGNEMYPKEAISFSSYSQDFFCSKCLPPTLNRCRCGKTKSVTYTDCGCGTTANPVHDDTPADEREAREARLRRIAGNPVELSVFEDMPSLNLPSLDSFLDDDDEEERGS